MFTYSWSRYTRVSSVLLLAGILVGCASGPVAQVAPTTPPAPTTASTAEPAATPVATASPASGPTAAATDSPAANATPAASAPLDEVAVKDGIQEALDLYAQAYNENKPELLKQAADQTNAPFRRFIQTRFENAQKSAFSGGGGYAFKVNTIKQRDFGFIEAQVESMRSGLVADWTFRQVDGNWVLSEPTEKQIGKQEKIESEHFIFYTYPWVNDVNPSLVKLMENARSRVLAKMGKVPEKKVNVYIKPIYGLGSFDPPQALAYADYNTTPNKMVIFAPHSHVFQFYDPTEGWEKELEDTLTHEYTHITNNQLFTKIVRMSDWMYEGVAEYVADSPRPGEVRAAIDSDQIIPIIDTSGQTDKQDLGHIYTLQRDGSLAYGLSESLVDYIAETYGGLEGFWKMVTIYDKTQDLNASLQQAFGVSYEQFDKDWRAWLKEKY